MKISIVTTCLNAAATIGETIRSVLKQTGDFELEYLVTDAGSTDGTVEIVRSFGDRITLIDAEGLNQTAGINLGLRLSSGDLVAFLNADDVYEEGALARVVDYFAREKEKLWLAGRCRIINEKGQECTPWITKYKNFLLQRYHYRLLLMENFVCQPAVFWRKSALSRVGYLDEQQDLVMDYEYWLRLGLETPPIIVNDYLACFRRFPGTKSNTSYYRQSWDDFRVALRYAFESTNHWLVPFKFFLNLKTVLTYSVIYR